MFWFNLSDWSPEGTPTALAGLVSFRILDTLYELVLVFREENKKGDNKGDQGMDKEGVDDEVDAMEKADDDRDRCGRCYGERGWW